MRAWDHAKLHIAEGRLVGVGDLFAPRAAVGSAQDVFTDRTGEQLAFDGSVTNHLADLELLAQGRWRAQDLDRPRNNILAYYGVGGIGKSTLLNRLADRLVERERQPSHWEPPPKLSVDPVVVQFDMRHAEGRGIEQLLVAIRAELAFHGLRTTAFDLYLGMYWAENHPNEPMNEFARRHGVFRRAAKMLGLQEHVESAVGDVVGVLTGVSTAGMSAVRLVAELGRHVADNRLRKVALNDCLLLESLLDAPKDDDSLSYSPYLLAWDLERIQASGRRLIAVFIDTFEEASDETAALLERVAWLLPNVLFVIAGRNRLAWNGDAGGVPVITGRTLSWVCLDHLAADEPRQHLVGNLSDRDARAYLHESLGVEIDADALGVIVDAAGGYPLHLDLSVQRFRQVAAIRAPSSTDFRVTFSQLATRVLKDLSEDERHALLACCLFDAFDVDLIRETLQLYHSGPIHMLFGKPLVQSNPHALYPWSIHSTLRQTLLTATDLGVDQWTVSDWRRTAIRAMQVVKKHIDGSAAERRGFLTLQLFQLGVTFGIPDPDLLHVAASLAASGSIHADWQPRTLPGLTKPDEPQNEWLTSLAAGLAVVMQRQRVARSEVNDRLKRLLVGRDDIAELDLLRYYQAETARDVGDLDESMKILDRLRSSEGIWQVQAVHGMVHLLRRLGRFQDVADILDTHRHELKYTERLRGDLAWTQALMDNAQSHYEAAVRIGRKAASVSEEATSLASAAYVMAWLKPDAVGGVVGSVDAALGTRFHSFSQMLCRVALLIAAAEDALACERIYDDLRSDALRLQQVSLAVYANLARAFGAAVRGEDREIESARGDLETFTNAGQFGYVLDIIDVWAGRTSFARRAHWVDEEALDRWAALPAQRRDLRGTLQ